MNTNLEQVLTETIVSSKKAVGEAVEWALKQVPDICDQYLKYEMFSAIINVVMITILSILIIIAYSKLWKWLGKIYKREEDEAVVIRMIIGGFLTLAFFVVLVPMWITEVKTIVKIHVAPKVYLVEFATKLVK